MTMVKDQKITELNQLWVNKRQLLFQVLNLVMIVLSPLMIWKGLMIVTKSEFPIVVVLSGSLGPGIQRGDILFLNNSIQNFSVGDIVVFKIKDRDTPIAHRILNIHENSDGIVKILTKGDDNRVNDRGLYSPGQLWLHRDDDDDIIFGKVAGIIPQIGLITIWLNNDYPVLKYVVLTGLLGLFVILTSKAMG